MKKLERLDTKLFTSLSNSAINGLASLQGGTYEEWTSKDKTCDTETHTGAKNCNSDNTKADCDVTPTDCGQDKAAIVIVNDPNDIASVVSTSIAY